MRREAPPERITAASMLSLSAPGQGRAAFVVQFFVRISACREVRLAAGNHSRIPPYRDQLRQDADGNLFGRERSNVQSHGRVDARKLFRAVAFPFERLING